MYALFVPSFLCTYIYKSPFLACLDTTYISCYTFFKRLKFEVFKTEKSALKNLNERKYRQSMKNLTPFKKLLSFYYTHYFKKCSQ